MTQKLLVTAALALGLAAPALLSPALAQAETQASDAPRPAADIMIQDAGPFGVPWGSYPAPTREGLGRYGAMTEIELDGRPTFNQTNLGTFVMNSQGFSYYVNAFFDPDSNRFNILTIESLDAGACDAIEARMVAALGDTGKTVKQSSDARGTYETQFRGWMPKAGQRTIYAYNFIPANGTDRDSCLILIGDMDAGIF